MFRGVVAKVLGYNPTCALPPDLCERKVITIFFRARQLQDVSVYLMSLATWESDGFYS
jgi:hypothetical protein